MLSKIQEGGSWSLNLNLESVKMTKGVRVRVQTQDSRSSNPDEFRTTLDLHLTTQEFERFRKALLDFNEQEKIV